MGNALDALWEWIEPSWRPVDVFTRIKQGFGSDVQLAIYDRPNLGQPFWEDGRNGLDTCSNLILVRLSQQGRLLHREGSDQRLNVSTATEFLLLASKINRVRGAT